RGRLRPSTDHGPGGIPGSRRDREGHGDVHARGVSQAEGTDPAVVTRNANEGVWGKRNGSPNSNESVWGGAGSAPPNCVVSRLARCPSSESPDVLLQKVHGSVTGEASAGRVIRRALVATEPVARALIDVHRHLGLGHPDLVPVLLGNGLVGLAEVQEHRTLRLLVGELRHGATVVPDGRGDTGYARGPPPRQ